MNRTAPRLRQVFARHRVLVGLTVVLLAATLLAGAGLLAVAAHFLTAAALAASLATGLNVFGPSAGIRALTLARIVSRYGEKLIGHDATLRIARDMRLWFFARMLPLAPLGLGRERIGDLLSRLVSDIDTADGLVVRALGPLLALLVLAAAVVAGMALALPTAGAWMALVLALLGLCVPLAASSGAGQAERAQSLARAGLRQSLQEGLEGAADLIAMDAVPAQLARVDAAADGLAHSARRLQRRLSAAGLLHGLVVAVALPVLLWLLLRGFDGGAITAPMAAALLFTGVTMFEAAAGLGLAWQSLRTARASLRRLREVAGQESPIVDPHSPRPLPESGELRLAQVCFAWEPDAAQPLLSDINLVVPPGGRVLVAGDSGAGKSSLMTLLLRLRDPDAGTICFGGVDLRQAAQAEWHDRIAWLPQEAPVFAGSIRDNLRMGDPAADDARLWDVLARVRLDAAVRALAQGLDSWIDESGASLSAGQSRRLALARALLRPAPLLLLDEPTEGLDADTAAALLDDLAGACQGRSLLVISHGAVPDRLVDARYRLVAGKLVAQPVRPATAE